MIKDSGERTDFDSGAQRDCQEGKGRMDLLPMRALIEVSKIYEAGAKKYAERNWEKGMPLSRYTDSGQRHLAKWLIGRDDENHLAMACWNFLCLLDTQERIKDGSLPVKLNDLPNNPDAKGFPYIIPAAWAEESLKVLSGSEKAAPLDGWVQGMVDDYSKGLDESLKDVSFQPSLEEVATPEQVCCPKLWGAEGAKVIAERSSFRDLTPGDFEAPVTDVKGSVIIVNAPPVKMCETTISAFAEGVKASIACGSWAKPLEAIEWDQIPVCEIPDPANHGCVDWTPGSPSMVEMEEDLGQVCDDIAKQWCEDFEAHKTFPEILAEVAAEGERILAEYPPISDEVAMAAIVKEWPEHEGTRWATKMKCKLQRVLQDMLEVDIEKGIEQIKPKTLEEWGKVCGDLTGEPPKFITGKMQQMGMTESCAEQMNGLLSPSEIAKVWNKAYETECPELPSDDLCMKPRLWQEGADYDSAL